MELFSSIRGVSSREPAFLNGYPWVAGSQLPVSGEDALLKSDHPHPDAGGLPARWVVRPARSRRGPALECEPPALRCGHAQYWALDGRRRLSILGLGGRRRRERASGPRQSAGAREADLIGAKAGAAARRNGRRTPEGVGEQAWLLLGGGASASSPAPPPRTQKVAACLWDSCSLTPTPENPETTLWGFPIVGCMFAGTEGGRFSSPGSGSDPERLRGLWSHLGEGTTCGCPICDVFLAPFLVRSLCDLGEKVQ
ncbi:uncharacterized protein LOC122238059 [Panthera tigris]|uniref:uncharacterized protein LOC122238059 n=1 Tax=Panthera tigris TaxID=9694 RepID=UPI001C6FB291|nr:uncharacterized protein LOC122238059 [Panthera tigris]